MLPLAMRVDMASGMFAGMRSDKVSRQALDAYMCNTCGCMSALAGKFVEPDCICHMPPCTLTVQIGCRSHHAWSPVQGVSCKRVSGRMNERVYDHNMSNKGKHVWFTIYERDDSCDGSCA